MHPSPSGSYGFKYFATRTHWLKFSKFSRDVHEKSKTDLDVTLSKYINKDTKYKNGSYFSLI